MGCVQAGKQRGDGKTEGSGVVDSDSPVQTHTFMMWEESENSAEGGGAWLVGEAGGLGPHWAGTKWNDEGARETSNGKTKM